MPTKPSDDDLCQALLDFVADSRFPESDSIVSSEFSAAAALKGLDIISTARAEVEVRIERIPRASFSIMLTGLYYPERDICSQSRNRSGYKWLDFSSEAIACRYRTVKGDSAGNCRTS